MRLATGFCYDVKKNEKNVLGFLLFHSFPLSDNTYTQAIFQFYISISDLRPWLHGRDLTLLLDVVAH